MQKLIERISYLMCAIAGWGFIACAVLIGVEVLLRNTFGISLQSTTELSGYALAFGISWGLAQTFITRGHVRIDVILNRMPLKARAVLHLVALATLGTFVGFLSYGAIALTQESWDFGSTDISLLRTPLVIPQGLWTFGILMFLLLIVLLFVEAIPLLLRGDFEAIDKLFRPRTYEEEAQEALDAVKSTP
ncbi:tripartite ATP-independent periplasmic transporters, DctQ component [Variibacter gotjawalensis]|uniref:TRAP transporter small permease protein n=1 Tax=Variibacter gotjawalensis TaxID=1333996 RepID=A0A0S3PVE4_9BRAD|nr:TRAP transporter small permease [Variibacter gotjawalensis]NIK45738.1 TRAP-type C4-dicarboxylate transport system permease small subunit [Variibacter gotjawalensis]RZS47662.1 TRAP-type C4-dicarboxylate transport system permease small subunit [Variibacter gotjawalensis]BAT59915.1 tripartite ATP-independent periplasmic transporters, DctQ component [Variibacter gotjawalensis]